MTPAVAGLAALLLLQHSCSRAARAGGVSGGSLVQSGGVPAVGASGQAASSCQAVVAHWYTSSESLAGAGAVLLLLLPPLPSARPKPALMICAAAPLASGVSMTLAGPTAPCAMRLPCRCARPAVSWCRQCRRQAKGRACRGLGWREASASTLCRVRHRRGSTRATLAGGGGLASPSTRATLSCTMEKATDTARCSSGSAPGARALYSFTATSWKQYSAAKTVAEGPSPSTARPVGGNSSSLTSMACADSARAAAA